MRLRRTTGSGGGATRLGRWHRLPAAPLRLVPPPGVSPPGVSAPGAFAPLPGAIPRDPDDRVAFVFQGGGSLTAGQVGMLRALAEYGVTPDLVVGSSAGALNAVSYAADPTPAGLDRLESIWFALQRRDVAPISLRTLVGVVAGRGQGLFSNAPLERLLRERLPSRTLEDTTVPAYVVATDIDSAEAVVLDHGDSVRALLASSAFPGLYPPVRVGERLLFDGGVAADIPVLQAEALGATVCYILPAAVDEGGAGQPRGPLPLAYRALGQILDGIARRDAAAARGRVFTLPTTTSRASTPVDFRDTARLVSDGYRLASGWLARLATEALPAAESVAAG